MDSQKQRIRYGLPPGHHGFTVVEVMVGIAIVSLLLALLLPAVQSVREVSRRVSCQNNLRQLAHGLVQYHEIHQSLPPSQVASLDPTFPPDRGLTFVFPFLELGGRRELIESGVQHISRLECPSDGDLSLVSGPISYTLNESPGQGSGSPLRGPFGRMITTAGYDTRAAVRFHEILDGVSNTAGISETLVTRSGGEEADANRLPKRYGFFVSMTPVSLAAEGSPLTAPALAERSSQTEASLSQCLEGPRTFLPQQDRIVASWGIVQNGPIGYSHWWPPNAPHCGPLGVGSDAPFIALNQRAASNHGKCVNVAFLDGHVRCVNEQIDRTVWRAIGTRDGSEHDAVGDY